MPKQLHDKTQEEGKMRLPGVEPGSQAWEACMMPLHYMRLETEVQSLFDGAKQKKTVH